MGRLAKLIKALGIGIIAAAESVSEDEDRSPGFTRSPMSGDVMPLEVENPYLDQDTANWIFESMDHQVLAMWPVVHGSTGQAFQATYVLAQCLLQMHTEDRESDRRGLMFEVARLVHSYLDDDQDPDDMPGVRGELSEGTVFDARPHLGAFLDASLRGDLAAAVSVSDAVGKDASGLNPALTPEASSRRAILMFAAGILLSLSRQWSLNEVPELLGVETDD